MRANHPTVVDLSPPGDPMRLSRLTPEQKSDEVQRYATAAEEAIGGSVMALVDFVLAEIAKKMESCGWLEVCPKLLSRQQRKNDKGVFLRIRSARGWT